MSIIPKLTIWASVGAVTQNRIIPDVSIVPLNVVPAGILNWIWFVDRARLKEVEVLANAGQTIKVIDRKIVKATNLPYMVFSISSTDT